MKEIKEHTNRWRIHRVHGLEESILWKWVYYLKQSIDSMQSLSSSNCILHRARTNNFTICMEIQKTSKSQSNLEKEEWNWRNQPAWLQALLQSHSHQDSMVLAKRQKYRSMEQNRKPRDKPRTYGHLIFNKGGKTIQWKTTSLTSGAGITGQPLVKEWN